MANLASDGALAPLGDGLAPFPFPWEGQVQYIHLPESAIRDFSMGSGHGMARWLRAVGSLPLSRKRPMCLHILAPTGLRVKAGGAVSGATTDPIDAQCKDQ